MRTMRIRPGTVAHGSIIFCAYTCVCVYVCVYTHNRNIIETWRCERRFTINEIVSCTETGIIPSRIFVALFRPNRLSCHEYVAIPTRYATNIAFFEERTLAFRFQCVSMSKILFGVVGGNAHGCFCALAARKSIFGAVEIV